MNNNRNRITHLDNEYTERKNKEAQKKKNKKTSFQRRMTLILTIGTFVMVMAAIPLVRNFFQAKSLEEERVLAAEELAELDIQQDELEYYIGLLENEEYVTKLARSQYYLTKDGEIVFSLPEDEKPDHQAAIEKETDEGQQKDNTADEK